MINMTKQDLERYWRELLEDEDRYEKATEIANSDATLMFMCMANNNDTRTVARWAENARKHHGMELPPMKL